MNSRILLTDLLNTYERGSNSVLVNCEVTKITDLGSHVEVESNIDKFKSRHVAICCADGISKFTRTTVKISYAPMFAVKGIDDEAESFVELDYFPKACINLLNKGNGYGLAGGISVKSRDEIKPYCHYCIDLHNKRNPNMKVLDMYGLLVGILILPTALTGTLLRLLALQ